MQTPESLPILTDEKNTIRFFEEQVPNDAASSSQVTFDTVLYVRISIPAQKDSVSHEVKRTYSDGRVRKNDVIYKRFGKYIVEYETSMESKPTMSGTPIEMWAAIDARRAAHLKQLGVYTVESLAQLSDAQVGAIGMGGRELRQKAVDWLKTAQDSKAAMETAALNRKLTDEVANLQRQVTDLADALETLNADEKARVKEALSKKQKAAA